MMITLTEPSESERLVFRAQMMSLRAEARFAAAKRLERITNRMAIVTKTDALFRFPRAMENELAEAVRDWESVR